MATHTKGSHSGGVSVDNIRHRSQKAVDYYKKNVQLIYQDKRESSASPLDAHGHSSTDNLNGSYGDDRRVDFSLMDDDLQEPEDGFLKRGGHRATVHGTGPSSKYTWNNNHNTGYKDKKSPESIVTYSSKRYSRGLNRSNSNSEMDSIEYIDADETSIHNRSIHRDYGSTSSLDMLGSNSVHNDSFFDMLSDFRHVNLDQRSPAPAKLQELLRGGYDRTKGQRHQGEKVSNGSVPNDKQSQDEVDSPRTKSKFKQKGDRKSRAKSITAETRPGIFTKFRGKPEAESGARTPENIDVDVRADERLRSKAFVHFDCQSVGFSILDVINKQSQATTAKNTSTGASAASASSRDSIAQDRDDPDLLADGEEGDNKSNGLVLSCQFFRNELGGEKERTISLGKTSTDQKSSAPSHLPESAINIPSRSPACCGISILDSSPNTNQIVPPHLVLHRGHVIEYYDDGATYYRNYFHGVDHQNYFGIDENLGPVAISIRREKLENRENNLGKADYGQYHYRIIFRTSELTTLRGSIIEDAIPSSGSRLSTSRGVLTKDVLEFVLPEVQTSCLKLGTTSSKTSDQLLKLDEQRLTKTHKVGIMFCKAGQSTEEEMYNNEHSSQAFDEFLTCIGQKVELKGFDKYRAQLDNKTNSTGTHSIYASFNNCEIMFHVSTMLPYTPSNKQQLLRKRHIGNDIVTIVFQEPGALPFTPKTVRSQFQHVFIIVRAHNPCSSSVQYSVAVSRSKDVPPFGPHIPDNAFFPKSSDFAEFILAKVINAENAAHRSEKFTAMATRTRTEYLKDLAQNYVTTNTLDSGSKLSKFGLGSGKKKEKAKQKVIPDMFSTGAIVWNIVAEDMGSKSSHIDCFLGISKEVLIIIEESTRDVIFTIHCGAIIGWTSQATSIRIYYNHGESISFKTQSGEMEEMGEICSRLQAVSYGCETDEMTLRRNGKGQLGFHIETAGIVTDVEKHTFAWEAGIRKGCRLVEICKVASVTLTHDEMVDLLRTSATVKVVVIRPLDDGTARGVATLHTNCHSSSLTTLNAALQATEHMHRRQKEVRSQSNTKSTEYLSGNGRETPPTRRSTNSEEFYTPARCSTNSDDFLSTKRRSSSSNEYPKNGIATPTRLSTNSDDYTTLFNPNDGSPVNRTSSMEQLLSKTDSIVRTPNVSILSEHLPFHHREVSKVSSSSSSEQSCHMREITISDQKDQIFHKRLDSHVSSSSGEQVSSTSPVLTSNFYENQKGSLTLPLQKKSSSASRGDKHPSPLKGLTSHFREYRAVNGTSSLNRGYNLHHAHTDPSMASKHDGRGSSFDEGYNTYSIRSENYLRSEDIRHERAGSKDSGSGDYSSIESNSTDLDPKKRVYVELDKLGFLPAGSTSSRPWSSRSSKNNSRGAWQDESSIDSGCHGSYLHMSESAPTMTSTLQRGQGHQSTSSGYQPPPPRKASVPFELGVQHGNISHELLKQPQNSKYLLSQGHGGQETVAGRVTGNSQNSSVNLSDMSFSSGSSHNSGANTMNRAVGELGTSYGRAEDGGAVSRKRADVISANNKGRPGFAQKRHQGDHSPLSSENSSPRSSHRNLSGMSSEESLNTRLRPGVSTGTKPLKLQNANNLEEELMRLIDPDLSNTEIRGILVSKGMLKATEKPRQAKLKRTMSEESLHSLKGSVLSGAVDNSLSDVIFSTANKHNQPQSGRPRAGHSTDSLSSTVPLPDSTAGLEWSSLVNVATKAIEGTADKPSGVKPKKSPGKEDKKEDLTKKSVLTGPTSYSSSTPVWRSVVANPQVRIQELEAKVNQLEHDLDKERKENAALEAEVQELRTENERLQEESQTAAAKLRKFTEWFFTTIDRQ